MNGLTISSIQAETMEVLSASGVTGDVLAMVGCALQCQGYTLGHPLDMLSRKYKQDQYFDKHHLAVKSETVIRGHRYEIKNSVTCTVKKQLVNCCKRCMRT